MTEDVTAIVPIKEHSERLPRKNFGEFNGKPLYHWILETLESVDEISHIVVNTDAAEVIEDAPDLFDVEVSVRPERLRDDEVTTNIIRYEIDRSDTEYHLHTYSTCPLLRPETISGAIREFVDSDEHDSLLPVTKHQKCFYDDAYDAINHDPHDISPSQDIPPLYLDCSVLYMYTEETFERTGHRIGTDPLPYEVDEREAVEIDYRWEFEMAECLHRRLRLEDA